MALHPEKTYEKVQRIRRETAFLTYARKGAEISKIGRF